MFRIIKSRKKKAPIIEEKAMTLEEIIKELHENRESNKTIEELNKRCTKMTLEDVLKEFSLEVEKWQEESVCGNTNCLSFGLGLPISSNRISLGYAYQCGSFYEIYRKNALNISNLNRYERLELDFNMLDYSYEEVDVDYELSSKDEWKLAFFQDYGPSQAFHVYRQTENGIWYHKPGRFLPTNLDNDGNIITNPIITNKEKTYPRFANLEYQKTYCLRRNH